MKANVLLDLPGLLCLKLESLEGITIDHPQKLRILSTIGLFRERLDYSQFTSLTKIYTGKRSELDLGQFH